MKVPCLDIFAKENTLIAQRIQTLLDKMSGNLRGFPMVIVSVYFYSTNDYRSDFHSLQGHFDHGLPGKLLCFKLKIYFKNKFSEYFMWACLVRFKPDLP